MQDGQENTYLIQGIHGRYINGRTREPITLTSLNPSIELPNPDLLKLHTYCCRVSYLSGAGGYLDNRFNDLNNTDVLCQDGSSADVLNFALREIIVG